MKAKVTIENKKVGEIDLTGIKLDDIYLTYQCLTCGYHSEIKLPKSIADMTCMKCEIKNKGTSYIHKLFITGIRIGV